MSERPITYYFKRVKQSSRKSPKPQRGKSVALSKKNMMSLQQSLSVPTTTSGGSLDGDIAKLRKEFDLDWRYGPCSGLTRLERWERAKRQNLNPPQEVKDIILSHVDDDKYVNSVWHEYKLYI